MAHDINALPINKKFNRRLVAPDTWIINPFAPNIATPRPYVVIGDEYALLIDPTYTTLPIREYVEKCVTDKPLKVLCSHSHLDHTNDNYMFEDCEIFMSAYAWEEIQARRKKEPKDGMWSQTDAEGKRVLMTKEQYGTYTPTIVGPGDKIDLGNRVLEFLPYEGIHSAGSLIALDHKTGTLFTGDEIECGQMLVMGRGNSTATIELLKENLVRLKEGWGDQIKQICPPHNGSPIHPLFLDYLIENCDRIMSGIDGEMDVGSMSYIHNPSEGRDPEQTRKILEDPDILRSEWKGTSIVYNKQKIFKKQVGLA